MCLIYIIQKVRIADIKINTSIQKIILTYLYSKKDIVIADLAIETIFISRHPAFIIETNLGRLAVNYTRSNYNTLLQLLEMKRYNYIEEFKTSVRKKFASFPD
jgi:hypothetical protein